MMPLVDYECHFPIMLVPKSTTKRKVAFLVLSGMSNSNRNMRLIFAFTLPLSPISLSFC